MNFQTTNQIVYYAENDVIAYLQLDF